MTESQEMMSRVFVKLLENMPAIVVLMIVAYNQQQQINMLLDKCIAVAQVCA